MVISIEPTPDTQSAMNQAMHRHAPLHVLALDASDDCIAADYGLSPRTSVT